MRLPELNNSISECDDHRAANAGCRLRSAKSHRGFGSETFEVTSSRKRSPAV
jgi:hypothetical protein